MIRWPEGHDPKQTAVHVRNELDMPVFPEAIWPWLVRAPLWPTWYPNSQNVRLEGGGQELKLGTKFTWKTFGASLSSQVTELVPLERLAWTAKASGIDAYHAWLVERRPSGCHVLTEETQNGLLARLNKAFRPGIMQAQHQVWLERLLEKGKSGPP